MFPLCRSRSITHLMICADAGVQAPQHGSKVALIDHQLVQYPLHQLPALLRALLLAAEVQGWPTLPSIRDWRGGVCHPARVGCLLLLRTFLPGGLFCCPGFGAQRTLGILQELASLAWQHHHCLVCQNVFSVCSSFLCASSSDVAHIAHSWQCGQQAMLSTANEGVCGCT